MQARELTAIKSEISSLRNEMRKHAGTSADGAPGPDSDVEAELEESFYVKLPCYTFEEFDQLEEELSSSSSKKRAMVSFHFKISVFKICDANGKLKQWNVPVNLTTILK